MKTITKELAETLKDEAIRELNMFYDSMSDEDMNGEYFNWISKKTRLILKEKNYKIPFCALPNKISEYEFNRLYPEKQGIINKYYKYHPKDKQYVICFKKKNVPDDDITVIVENCVLKRGNVVWIEFGFNIDCEFGGRHPAIILKRYRKAIIVAPLSSKEPNSHSEDESVNVGKIYNFHASNHWTNVFRIKPVSIQRIDFTQKAGSVSSTILDEINEKIKKYIAK